MIRYIRRIKIELCYVIYNVVKLYSYIYIYIYVYIYIYIK